VPFLAQRGLIDRFKKLPAAFYETPFGTLPVREWILARSIEDRKIIGREIQEVEFHWACPIVATFATDCGKSEAI
jgi:hypothetical protein